MPCWQQIILISPLFTVEFLKKRGKTLPAIDQKKKLFPVPTNLEKSNFQNSQKFSNQFYGKLVRFRYLLYTQFEKGDTAQTITRD